MQIICKVLHPQGLCQIQRKCSSPRTSSQIVLWVRTPGQKGRLAVRSGAAAPAVPAANPNPWGSLFSARESFGQQLAEKHQVQGKASTKNISKVGEAIWCIAVDKAVQRGLHVQQEQLLSGKRGNLKC